jgi:hypothetical protein
MGVYMTVDRITIELSYEPSDFVERPIYRSCAEYDLVIQAGRAQATLKTPTDPVPDDLKISIQKELGAIFTALQVCMHRTHKPLAWGRMSIHQQRANGSPVYHAIIAASGSICATGRSGHADFIVTDASGRILRNSKAERIAEQDRFVDLILKGIPKHPLVSVLLKSYGDAVNDPDNELVHLFEIRDALAKHFGKDQTAQKRLQITEEWKRLGKLANDEPVEQSRHRGKHFEDLRPASPQELEEARVIAKKLIEAFIDTL